MLIKILPLPTLNLLPRLYVPGPGPDSVTLPLFWRRANLLHRIMIDLFTTTTGVRMGAAVETTEWVRDGMV